MIFLQGYVLMESTGEQSGDGDGDDGGNNTRSGITAILALTLAVRDLHCLGAGTLHAAICAALDGTATHDTAVTLHCKHKAISLHYSSTFTILNC